ncbi:MAG TPA: tetratricopeptide repeat protein [Methylomirabilota bacterium]|nr:tetratricopeptide repeat protein [Methylomirabilota bacterium]
MRRTAYRIVSIVLVASMLASCASTKVPPIDAEGQAFKLAADERQLWQKAEQEAEKLEKTGKLYEDPMLEEFLGKMGDRLAPDTVKQSGAVGFRFFVFRDPTLNAFALPNGRIYVHTGLLSRVENEAQLATVVAHEMAHVTNRDALRFNRDARNKSIAATVLAIVASIGVAAVAGDQARRGNPVAAAVLSQTAHVMLGLGLQLSLLAAINGYGRGLEAEADEKGMENLVRAGYDPNEAPKVFELLSKDSEDHGKLENFFFGSHPRLQERIETTTSLLRGRYQGQASDSGRIRDTEEFQLRMRSVVRENAALDVRAGRFDLAAKQLDRVLALTPKDPIAHTYYGDLYRLKSQRAKTSVDKQELIQKALVRYEEATALDPTLPDPHRQLGLLYYQQRNTGKAKEAFQRYLALAPNAPDARRVKEYLVELDR